MRGDLDAILLYCAKLALVRHTSASKACSHCDLRLPENGFAVRSQDDTTAIRFVHQNRDRCAESTLANALIGRDLCRQCRIRS
jgi:hypothetical protein